MNRTSPTDRMDRLAACQPTVNFVYVHLRGRIAHARDEDTSRGASAVEWVVISAIVVAIVAVVGGILMKTLKGKANSVSTCIDKTDGSGGEC